MRREVERDWLITELEERGLEFDPDSMITYYDLWWEFLSEYNGLTIKDRQMLYWESLGCYHWGYRQAEIWWDGYLTCLLQNKGIPFT